jgi:hypothetical protein
MQSNFLDTVGRLVAQGRRQVAAWRGREDFGLCLLAIGLLLLPAFVSAGGGGPSTYQTAASPAVPAINDCPAGVRQPPESRRGVHVPAGREFPGKRKLLSVYCNGRARVGKSMALLIPPLLTPALVRLDIEPDAPSAILLLGALLTGLMVTATGAFVAAGGLFGWMWRGALRRRAGNGGAST